MYFLEKKIPDFDFLDMIWSKHDLLWIFENLFVLLLKDGKLEFLKNSLFWTRTQKLMPIWIIFKNNFLVLLFCENKRICLELFFVKCVYETAFENK